VSITTPLGNTTQQYFDGVGRLRRVTDPLGRVTIHDYDALNQVTAITDAAGGQTLFTYDPNGNQLTVVDANGKTTTWAYDNMNGAVTRTDPLSRQESFSYDENGNLTSWTDRKSQVTTYVYDALDRQTFVGFGTTGAPPTYASATTTTYDAADRVATVVDSVGGAITLAHDSLDRLTSETTPEGTVSYTYDSDDRRANMTVSGQPSVVYAFDAAHRLTGVVQGGVTTTLAYDDANRRTSLTLPSGIVVQSTYDSDSRLTGLTYVAGITTLGDLSYSYNGVGQRTAIGGTLGRTGLPAALASATYDDANQIASWSGTAYTYDSNGNLASDGSRNYFWNARNELSSVSGPVVASFSYDGFGRRKSKTVAGSTKVFLYDGPNLVQELSGGVPTANLLTGLAIDEHLARTDTAGARNYLTDALGSTLALADAAGTVQTEYTYEPFGATATSGGATTNRLGFTGRESDETGLTFLRARFYDPRLQRFIAEDPIDFLGGDVNLHTYAANDPVNLVDPEGTAFPGSMTGPFGIRCSGPPPGSPPKNEPWWQGAGRAILCDPNTFMPGPGPLAGVGAGAARGAGPLIKAAGAAAQKRMAKRARDAGRRALEKLTGKSPKDFDAHHNLVVKHIQYFESKGLDISHPEFMSWVERTFHQRASPSITRAWDAWINQHGATASPAQILAAARQIAAAHGIPWP
jgi:RHS repeat-associated protein